SESGSQKILDTMDRRVKVEQVIWALQALKRRSIKTGLFLMLGYSGETEDDLAATLDLLRKGEPDEYLTTVSYPIKGTPYYTEINSLIERPRPWHDSTERDWIVQGRPSKAYYAHAARWIEAEYDRHKTLNNGAGGLKRRWSGYRNSLIGRVGMALEKRRDNP
ncbi:MAG: B12-binding domain-containing radical SAM protein, partial [Elusimicrobia bacterium]|nr:B12-binding domain-containing radical SAM protein [Elusimicrobiota bacterium]